MSRRRLVNPWRPARLRSRTATLTGAVGLSGLAVAVAVTGVPPVSAGGVKAEQVPGVARGADDGPDGVGDSTQWRETANGEWGGTWGAAGAPDGKRPADRHDPADRGRPVRCDAASLVAAITTANANGGGMLSLAEKCTYELTTGDGGNGLPPVVQPVTINGNGARITRAANAEPFRILDVAGGGKLTLRDLVVANGRAPDDQSGGGIRVQEGASLRIDRTTIAGNVTSGQNADGAGIANQGVTSVKRSTITGNTASEDGAGLYNLGGLVTVEKSTVTRNVAGDTGGGIENDGGVTTISHTLIGDNRAADTGGGLINQGDTVKIFHSAVTGNAATIGGGIVDNSGDTLLVTAVTVRKNTAQTAGGGVAVTASTNVTIDDSAITDNVTTAGDGGGVWIEDDSTDRPVAIRRLQRGGGHRHREGGHHRQPAHELHRQPATGPRVLRLTRGGALRRPSEPAGAHRLLHRLVAPGDGAGPRRPGHQQ
ncbi:right-handed parallel beta-helix repeat-containing protein [Micromonospora sp. WMMA1363]|uniref:right-handed parallel beta-helix repeat-containing protein n=1 Tax=Micromonospora sp. WMMA1363 TaxID=3053985 RepID=UPI00259D0769|nr:right-handed parallel beta-helix repeat-containing protein [Micromonospora sp. WMMA1363]MDM4719531.1 right-handed parallel beta-helix repeat-containing protein [Micromonospora sp. WMMA1363]